MSKKGWIAATAVCGAGVLALGVTNVMTLQDVKALNTRLSDVSQKVEAVNAKIGSEPEQKETETETGTDLVKEVEELKKSVSGSEEKLDKLYSLIMAAVSGEPKEGYIGGIYKITDPTPIADAYKTGNTEGLSDQDKETLALAEKVLEEVITEGMSEYEKEEAVYRWITTNVSFDEGSLIALPEVGEYVNCPYGALKYHSAVCIGYATTFELLTKMLGMESMVVVDSSASHSWNCIKMDDGEYYMLDLYMDADKNGPSYENFNVTSSILRDNGHDWNEALYPEANGVKYNYMVMHAVPLTEPDTLVERVLSLLEEKSAVWAFKTENYTVAQAIGDALNSISTRDLSEWGVWYMNIDTLSIGDDWYVSCRVEYEEEEPEDPEDPEEPEIELDEDLYEKIQEKLSEKIDEVFGKEPRWEDDDDDSWRWSFPWVINGGKAWESLESTEQ